MGKIVICGATGSIGQQTADVAKKLGIEIVGVTYNAQHDKAKAIVRQLKVPYWFCHSDAAKGNVASFDELLKKARPRMVVNAISGYAGLNVSSIALNHRIDLGLANKESMVIAGHWLNKIAARNKTRIYPIDSEHSSFWQLTKNLSRKEIAQYIITASGGPFWGFGKDRLKTVTRQQALSHPTWKMGPKITVDSATLANKAFEMIELFHLFGSRNVVPVRHKQSLVHAIVQLKDNSYLFGASHPDMRLPIQLCLQRYRPSSASIVKPLGFQNMALSFEPISESDYPLIKIARDVIANPATTRGAVFNVANDFAVDLFLNKQIPFHQIVGIVANFYRSYPHKKVSGLVAINLLIRPLLDKLKASWKNYV